MKFTSLSEPALINILPNARNGSIRFFVKQNSHLYEFNTTATHFAKAVITKESKKGTCHTLRLRCSAHHRNCRCKLHLIVENTDPENPSFWEKANFRITKVSKGIVQFYN